MQSLMDLDTSLSTVHEKYLMMQAGKRQYTVEEQEAIKKHEAVYQQFKDQCLQLGQWDFLQYSGQILEYVQSLQQGVDWSAAVFQ